MTSQEKFELKTPIGTVSIKYGEFIKGDNRKYSCWWNGCGIGDYNSLKEAKIFLLDYVHDRLIQAKEKHERERNIIKKFLLSLTERMAR